MELVPACLGTFILVFGFIALLRYLNYRGTIVRAEKGLTHQEAKHPKSLLRWGIGIAACGLALTLALYPIGFISEYSYPLHLGPWMLAGLIPLFLGLGLVLLHYLTEKD